MSDTGRIILGDRQPLASGTLRKVFAMPGHPDRVIKVMIDV